MHLHLLRFKLHVIPIETTKFYQIRLHFLKWINVNQC